MFRYTSIRPALSLLLLFLLQCTSPTLKAQQQYFSYSMKRLSQDDGLSQGSNYFRYEDSKGFIWITGNDALNRYDGSVIKVYNLNRYFKDCPPLQQGYGFTEDDKSNIYIGSVNGLYIYHRKTDKFSLLKMYPGQQEALAMPFAYKDGKVWCFNRNYEISTYDASSGSISGVTKIPLPAINSVHVYDMLGPDGFSFYYRFPLFDNNNNLWCFGASDIYRFNKNTKQLQQIDLKTLTHHQNRAILCTSFDKLHNELWIGCSKGLLIYDIQTGMEQFIKRVGKLDLGEVNSIASNGNVIALRSTSGTLLSDRKFGSFYWASYPSRIFSRRVYDFGFDKAGRLWMCDDGLGQAIYSFSQPLLPRIPGNNNEFAKLKEKGVGSFAEMPNGDIYFHSNFFLEHSTRQLKTIHPLHAVLGYQLGFRAETDPIRKGIWVYRLNDKQQLQIYFVEKEGVLRLMHNLQVPGEWGTCNTLKVLNDGRILISFSNGLFWLKNNKLIQVNTIPGKSLFTISTLSNNRYAISYLNKDMWLVATDSTDNIRQLRSILGGVQSFYMQEDTLRQKYWVGTNKGIYLLAPDFQDDSTF